MITGKRFLAWLTLTLLFLNISAAAEEEPQQKGSFNFQFENDVFNPDPSDRHYTNGMLFSYQTGENRVWNWLDGWARRHYFPDPDVRLHASLAVGHNLYTPEDISTTELVTDDRPYAGWLHVDLGLVGQVDDVLRTMQLSFGMVGPAAKGEEFQKWIHKVIDSPEPMGWDNQLNNEPTMMLLFEQKWRNVFSPGFFRGLGLDVDLSPHGSVALGNVFTYGGVGGTVRLGQGLERDFGPPRIQPAPPGSGFCTPRGDSPGICSAGWTAGSCCTTSFWTATPSPIATALIRTTWSAIWWWGRRYRAWECTLVFPMWCAHLNSKGRPGRTGSGPSRCPFISELPGVPLMVRTPMKAGTLSFC